MAEKYRPNVDATEFRKELTNWKNQIVYGAFFKETGELVGCAKLSEKKHVL